MYHYDTESGILILNPEALKVDKDAAKRLADVLIELIAERIENYGRKNNESKENGKPG